MIRGTVGDPGTDTRKTGSGGLGSASDERRLAFRARRTAGTGSENQRTVDAAEVDIGLSTRGLSRLDPVARAASLVRLVARRRLRPSAEAEDAHQAVSPPVECLSTGAEALDASDVDVSASPFGRPLPPGDTSHARD
jgi:hypothetical protein